MVVFSPTYEKLLTCAWSYCRIVLTTTSLEEFLGSVLYEVPVQEGDEQRPGHHDEKRPPGHSGCMPSLLHEDVPDWQSRIAQRLPLGHGGRGYPGKYSVFSTMLIRWYL